MSKKNRRRREPDPDDQEPEMSHDSPAIVRCVECHVDYSTSMRAFHARGCKCPKCGSSKAQLRSPLPNSDPSPAPPESDDE